MWGAWLLQLWHKTKTKKSIIEAGSLCEEKKFSVKAVLVGLLCWGHSQAGQVSSAAGAAHVSCQQWFSVIVESLGRFSIFDLVFNFLSSCLIKNAKAI